MREERVTVVWVEIGTAVAVREEMVRAVLVRIEIRTAVEVREERVVVMRVEIGTAVAVKEEMVRAVVVWD